MLSISIKIGITSSSSSVMSTLRWSEITNILGTSVQKATIKYPDFHKNGSDQITCKDQASQKQTALPSQFGPHFETLKNKVT